MTLTKATAFLRQPSTVLGLSALLGTLTAVLTAQLTWQGAIPAIVGALAAIALPDDAGAQAALKDAAAAVIQARRTARCDAEDAAAAPHPAAPGS